MLKINHHKMGSLIIPISRFIIGIKLILQSSSQLVSLTLPLLILSQKK